MATQAMTAAMNAGGMKSWPAGIPVPVQQCDGTWLTPLWRQDSGQWELCEQWDDTPLKPVSRAQQCGDPQCDTIHLEDVAALDRKRRAEKARARGRRVA